MDNLRKRKRDEAIIDFEPDELRSESNPHSELVKNENKTMIEKAVHNLSAKQKEVFLLRIYSGMTFKEISAATNEPINTVLSHMNYSIKKIKKALGQEND